MTDRVSPSTQFMGYLQQSKEAGLGLPAGYDPKIIGDIAKGHRTQQQNEQTAKAAAPADSGEKSIGQAIDLFV